MSAKILTEFILNIQVKQLLCMYIKKNGRTELFKAHFYNRSCSPHKCLYTTHIYNNVAHSRIVHYCCPRPNPNTQTPSCLWLCKIESAGPVAAEDVHTRWFYFRLRYVVLFGHHAAFAHYSWHFLLWRENISLEIALDDTIIQFIERAGV